MVLTVVAMSGVVVPSVNAAASAGDLIKMEGNSSVYYLGADAKRYVFPNEATYMSWYSDFSGVVTIPAAELQSYALGGNVTMRPGTKLVKITTDPSVYAVETNGTLRKIQSEAQAAALYGTNWNTKIVDVPDAFFTNYNVGSVLPSGQYSIGSLIKNAGASEIFYYDGTSYRKITNEAAFNANRFNMANVLTASTTVSGTGTEISAVETGLVNVSQGASTPDAVITGSGLMVSLSSMTPAGTGIPAASPMDFLKVNLTAANDGAVNVSAITLTAYDLGTSTFIDEVTFYDNGVKVGTSKNFTSDRVASFSFATPIVVNAGTTKTLTVKATIEASQTGNFAIGIAKAADVTATASAVTGSFPVVSNTMSIVSGATIGTVGLTNAVTTDTTNKFGEDNVLLAEFDLTANNEPVLIQSIKLRNGGTDTTGIVDNLKLFVDGTEVASGTYADKYVTFSLNNYKIAKSDTVQLEVRGDLGVTNNNDTFVLYIKDVNDFGFIGQDYGFGVQLTTAGLANLDTTTEGITVTLTTGQFTIDMDKSATPAKDVKAGDNDVVLATLVMKSNGEDALLEQIVDSGGNDFEINGTGLEADEIENVEMRDVATGAVYDITATRVGSTQWTLSMTDEITLLKGVAKTFQIRADMSDSVAVGGNGGPIDDGDTLYVVLDGAAMTITGETSNASITDITPSSVTSATVTVKDASLTWTPTALSTQTVVGGAQDVVVYQASLKAGTADGIKLSSVTISTDGADTAFTDDDITKLDLYLNGKLLKSVSNSIVETTGGADGYITFNSFSSEADATIAAGATVNLMVKASFASTVTAAGTFDLELESADDATSRAVSSNDSVTETGTISGVSGNITTTAKGTLKVELLVTDVKADEDTHILAGSAVAADRYLAELKFTTENEPIKVTRLRLENSGTSASDDVASVRLVTGSGTIVAEEIPEADGDVLFDPFDYVLAADQTTSLFIAPVVRGLNVLNDPTSTADYNETMIYNIDDIATGVVATGVNSSASITLVVDPDADTVATGQWAAASITSNTATIVGSALTTITNAMSDATLTGGTAKILGKYTFVFDNGSNRNASNEELKAYLDALKVTVNKSTAVVITNVNAQIDGTATKVAGDITTLGNGNTSGSVDWLTTELQGLADGGKLDGTVTLVITGDVTTTDATSEYVQTSLADVYGAGDVDYIGNGATDGTILTATYLPVAEVIGGTLSE
ncbi:TPA: hypothetical protein DCZ15_03350 [Candidatus Falkowbacteria bacterium]|nr:hypothetical protein [Candidatus Falkowbacteria bacterium]